MFIKAFEYLLEQFDNFRLKHAALWDVGKAMFSNQLLLLLFLS
jgi:hypothetical protein